MAEVMIVTGAGRGIGAAVARHAGQAGYDVCVNYSSAREHAERLVAQLREGGTKAIAVQADVSREDQVQKLFAEVDRTLGPVNALVNNAGINHHSLLADLDISTITRVIEVNFHGVLLCSREAVRRMSTRLGGNGGTIVNISSASARTGGMPGTVVYSSTKGAVDTLTKGLANEVVKEGIRVCGVRPGIVETEIFDDTIGLAAATRIAEQVIPLGRAGRPDEIAALAVWLCSPAASYVTGVLYDVSGGR